MASSLGISEKRTLPTPEELAQALEVEVYDREGKSTPLGELTKGKRTALVFVRNWFLVIGCGGYQPIDNWIAASSSKHSVYADPSNRLHAILKFKSTLSEGDGKDPRDYMSDQGGAVARWLGGMKAALSSVQQLPYIGPKSQNGGEVIISADGDCEYISRMQNTVDHINVSELAILLGVSGKGISEG